MAELKGNLPSLPAKVLRPMVGKQLERDSAMAELKRLEEDRLQPIKTENDCFMKKVIQKQSGRLHTLVMKLADSEERAQPRTMEGGEEEAATFTSTPLSRILRLETSHDIQDSDAEVLGAMMVFYYEVSRVIKFLFFCPPPDAFSRPPFLYPVDAILTIRVLVCRLTLTGYLLDRLPGKYSSLM